MGGRAPMASTAPGGALVVEGHGASSRSQGACLYVLGGCNSGLGSERTERESGLNRKTKQRRRRYKEKMRRPGTGIESGPPGRT
jgi:hypothetical protein